MKYLLLTATLSFSLLFSFAQTGTKRYHFKEIGASVEIPEGFKLQDPEPEPKYYGKGMKPIKNKKVIEQLTQNDPKKLLAIESKDKESKATFTLIPITEEFKMFFGDSAKYIAASKKGTIAAMRQATESYDTLFTKVTVGDRVLDKLFATAQINGVTYYQGGYILKLNNYYLSVDMFYKGEMDDQMQRMISSIRFD
jgi:hypothetical protein